MGMSGNVLAQENTKTTRAELVRLQLAEDIVAGKLRPGTRLDEVEQAKRFGVSRTPVREAFRELAALGLVENRPHRGVIVTPGLPLSVEDLAEACGEMLAVCARLAAARMTDAASLAAAGSDHEAVEKLADGTGNAVLRDCVLGLWGRLRPFLATESLLRDALQALGRRDCEAAAQAFVAALRGRAPAR